MANIREDIRSFINSNVSEHPSDIALITAQKFGISRQRVNAYLTREIKNGKIIKTGRTSSTRYYLVDGNKLKFSLKLSPDLAEDRVWTKYVKPMLLKYPRNIYNVCYYGFTEILNNAIDHSNGTLVYISIEIKNDDINIEIIDNGIGIFKKIQNALNLESDRESILHLSKGKFTTDPKNHTGEGIFFTSRIFDNFSIFSGNLFYIFKNEDWFHSSERREEFGKGTLMNMHISLNSKKTAKEVMDKYTDEEIGFTKTIVSVALSADPGDPHVFKIASQTSNGRP